MNKRREKDKDRKQQYNRQNDNVDEHKLISKGRNQHSPEIMKLVTAVRKEDKEEDLIKKLNEIRKGGPL